MATLIARPPRINNGGTSHDNNADWDKCVPFEDQTRLQFGGLRQPALWETGQQKDIASNARPIILASHMHTSPPDSAPMHVYRACGASLLSDLHAAVPEKA
ncbi:hypothetical protein LTR56_019065 [Elasticomyces elasticus]|nr:hypothetical protein LTR56_019065 [Elasticomyces elasticus]KAK3645055.1 hypothetical protein LTR22_014974 [Elasticomyces elasticus]KAK4915326.1 hypothetical protein LTR49_016595 [Elasticomyces elasticus]